MAGLRCGGSPLPLRVCPSSLPVPGNVPVFSGGVPARRSAVPRGSVLSAPMWHDMYISSSEAPPISRPPSGLWGASGSVRCRLGWFGSCVFCLLSVCPCCAWLVARHQDGRTVCGYRFRSAVGKWRTECPVSKVWAALGLRSPGSLGDGNGRGEEPPHRSPTKPSQPGRKHAH